ncbi:hypothetical protein GCM10011581_08440 [Saccharopolyspora subtropica]|uniref:Uncharacterized protein n=1 Tax=Saccharopolyspora thermophila TaxID=89367 RepID=A0A917N794_9PSEU|nr:hypothetical protein [Saccharopolyspora subtropica]GGI73796.1 hypothetical protein GCM10011581_08440 [Saccharopolyspora subtropica]
MTNPYGPPPGSQPYPQQGPMAPPPGAYGPPSGPQPMHPPMPQPPMQQGMPPQGYPQPGMPQPPAPMPQPMAPPPPGMARIMIDCSYFWLAWMLMFFKPQVTINGQPGPILNWGKTPIDLPPGQHQIQIHVNYLWRVGNATAVIPVNAGQQVDVYYAAPVIVFVDGAIGPVPQKAPGMGLALGIMGGSIGLCFLIVLLSIISAL